MDIKSLKTFIHVAELGSFSRAGDRLGYSQPTVSVQIKQLEQELGIQLFDRIGKAVRLTDKGRDALVYAQQVLHLTEQMTQNPSQQARYVIRLATADSLSTPLAERIFQNLRQIYPHISLKITAAGTTELFRLLDHNEADLVCTLDSHIYNTNYRIAAEEKIGVHFVVGANHPLAAVGTITRQDLMREDLMLTEAGMSYRRLLDEWMAKASLELQPVLETGRADLICQLVEKGLGLSFLPDYVTQDAVDRAAIVRLKCEDFRPELWMQILYHRDKWVSQPLDSVIRLLCGEFTICL